MDQSQIRRNLTGPIVYTNRSQRPHPRLEDISLGQSHPVPGIGKDLNGPITDQKNINWANSIYE